MADPSVRSPAQHSFVLLGFLGRFCDLPRGRGLLLNTLDNAHCYGLTHVTNCKATWEMKIIRKTELSYDYKSKVFNLFEAKNPTVDKERPSNTLVNIEF